MTAQTRLTGKERKAQIMDAALKVFARAGFSGARTKEIAKAAGISETLIFRHFDSKEDLYQQSLQHMFSGHPLIEELEEAKASQDPKAVFLAAARHMIVHGRRDAKMTRLLLFNGLEGSQDGAKGETWDARTHKDEAEEVIAEFIAHKIASGEFREMDPTFAAKLFLYLIFMFIADHHLKMAGGPMNISDDQAAEFIVDFYLKGMTAKE